MYYGDTIAEKAMMRLNAKIKKTFAQAHREMSEKLQSHIKQFEKDDKKYREMVRNGKLKKSDYNKWKQEQVFTGKQWSNMVSDITSQIANADKTTERMINGERRSVFQDNVNYASYSIDKDYNFGLTFTIYDSATVTQLIKEDPKLLPDVKIDEDGYYRWNKQLVSSAVTQSIIQGETIPQTAERIGEKLSLSNEKAMTRVARTAMTSAQNSGRIESMHNAQDMGIAVKKLWIATLDRRTRDAHGELDGQTADVDDPFHSSLGDIYYPGDPDARPANVWNCRCSLGWEYPEYQNQYDTRAAREYDSEEDEEGHTVEVPYMTYSQWEQLKTAENQGIQIPDQEAIEEEPIEKELIEPEYSEEMKAFLKECEQTGIEYHEVHKLDTEWAKQGGFWAESEIIERLHGGDLTDGSCMSLALAYAGNRCGYDVLDFRGGASRAKFSSLLNIKRIINFEGCKFAIEEDTNDRKAVERLFATMQKDKEYILITGCHAAIVRDGGFGRQYLELQSEDEWAWQEFEYITLPWRFGAKSSHTYNGIEYKDQSFLIDVDSFKNVAGFDKLLGYINTPESEQLKGSEGHEK